MTCLVSIDSRQIASSYFWFLWFLGSSGGIRRASARKRGGCRQIETFLGIGCQIESAGTSAPYHSTRRRVCRMFNDGRGRFRVSETGLPNPRLVSAHNSLLEAETPVLVCVTTRRIKTRSCVIYIDAHENAAREYFNIFTRHRKWTSVTLENVSQSLMNLVGN